MGWPTTAVYESVVPGGVAKAATILEMQEREVDLFGGRKSLLKGGVDGVGDQAPPTGVGDGDWYAKRFFGIAAPAVGASPDHRAEVAQNSLHAALSDIRRRQYVVDGRGLPSGSTGLSGDEYAYNAYWDTGDSLWHLSDPGAAALLVRMSITGGVQVYAHAASPSTWADSAWTAVFGASSTGATSAARFEAFGDSPTVVLGTGAGTGSSYTLTARDNGGRLLLTTGTGPAAGATLATVTFSSQLANTPKSVALIPADPTTWNLTIGGANQAPSLLSVSNTNFVIGTNLALAAATTYQWDFILLT